MDPAASPGEDARHTAKRLLPAVLLVATTAAGFAICVLALMAGWLTIFQNVLYIPIIIACVFFLRRGLVFSAGIALGYFTLMARFSQDPAVLQGALIRVAIFVLVAAVVTYLAEVRARAERDLREANEYLTNLIAYANAPIVVWDRDYRITRFNRAFSQLTGIPPGEAIGSRIGILFPEATRESSMEVIRRATAGEAMEVAEIPVLQRTGEVRTVLWNSANIHGPDGVSVIATIAQGQDITERKRVEEALQMANRKLNLLSSITRHDINNQLTVIQGYAALLAEERLDPAIQERGGVIAKAARRAWE
ncbi:MAG: PAS domain S-box protein [Methanolinea sp.]